MILFDVNVLVYASREDAPDHARYRAWLQTQLAGPEAVGISELVLAGVLRILTHPQVFAPPTPLSRALQFLEALRTRPNAVLVIPGARHWEIFVGLCRSAGTRGNLISDAWHAALAIEHGCDWITTDRDYARFPGLRWRHPLEA
jgi:toxin-antitoxin system PIN domain toxin